MPEKSEVTLERAAKPVINQVAAIIRTSQIHDPGNVAVVQAIDRLVAMMKALHETVDAVVLEVVGEYFFINDQRVKFAMDQLVNFDFLVREYRKLGIGAITFRRGVTAENIQSYVRAHLAAAFAGDPYNELSNALAGNPVISVSTPRKEKDRENVQTDDVRKMVKNTYFNAVSFTRGVMKKIQTGEKVDVKRAKRVVQSLVDSLLQQEDILIGMTAIKDYDDYTYHHSVNVSVVALAVGQRLGFNKQMLLELGMVALFHDIGKMEIPPEVLNKPGAFTPEEWRIVKRHPMWGLRAILKMKGFDALSIRAAIVAFEHHLRFDDAGYPPRRFAKGIDLYSRIVSISDQYDGMTSARVYSRTPMTPEKALSLMMERVGVHIDPIIFKFFVNMVGVYPVGTALMLNTRQLALVYSNNMMSPDRPRVMIISDPAGKKIQGQLVDLADKNPDNTFKYSILKALDPHKYKINLAEYLL